MDERYLLAAVRYVKQNPVAAGLCRRAEDWRWSSAVAHIRGQDKELVQVRPMLSRVDDWAVYLSDAADDGISAIISRHSRTGRLLSDGQFVQSLERITDCVLARYPRGRKRKVQGK